MGHHGIANHRAPNPRSPKTLNSGALLPDPCQCRCQTVGEIVDSQSLIAFMSSSGRRVRFAEGRVHDGGGRYERSDCTFVAGDNEERGNRLDTVESQFIMTHVPAWKTRTKCKFVEKITQGGRERSGGTASGSGRQRLTETTMSVSYLPAEILDHVVDHLHDTPDALRNCCLVSRSWIPRARTHLFADIRFHTVEDLGSWKETFPDPSTSPMCYAKTLTIDCPSSDAEVGGWIRGFSRVVHLEVRSHRLLGGLVPLHGFSPAIKSLHMVFDVPPPPCAFDLVLSFPLLENLTLKIFFESSASGRDSDWPPPAAQPSSPPMFTGSLELYLRGGMKHIIHRLLSLPGGIHFWKLTLTWCREGDLMLLTALVGECFHTLESLNITCSILGTDNSEPTSAPITYFRF
jgi:hypothetical protein